MLASWPATRPLVPIVRLAGCYTALNKDPQAAQRWQHVAAATPPAPSAAAHADTRQQEAQPPQLAQQPAQQQGPMFLVRNETPVPCTMSSGAFLEASPRGAYTTARTVGGSSVFELSFHIDRLASSARLMMEADAQAAAAAAGGASGGPPPTLPPAAAAVANPAQLRPRVLAAMRAAVRGYRAATGDAAGELKLTVLITWPGGTEHEVAPDGLHAADSQEAPPPGCSPAAAAADVFVHVSPLPPRPAPPVRVVMRGAPRQNAAAKDSEWVRQRKALEVGLPAGVNEVVLVDSCGGLFEGLSSNFFAVLDGTVYTAGEGILAGTVREVALQVAAREGIPVVLHPPQLQDLDHWEGCFISSTSRLLLPVDEASILPEDASDLGGFVSGAANGKQGSSSSGSGGTNGSSGQAAGMTRRFERGGLVQRLEQLVLAEVAACSEPLFN